MLCFCYGCALIPAYMSINTQGELRHLYLSIDQLLYMITKGNYIYLNCEDGNSHMLLETSQYLSLVPVLPLPYIYSRVNTFDSLKISLGSPNHSVENSNKPVQGYCNLCSAWYQSPHQWMYSRVKLMQFTLCSGVWKYYKNEIMRNFVLFYFQCIPATVFFLSTLPSPTRPPPFSPRSTSLPFPFRTEQASQGYQLSTVCVFLKLSA